MHTHEAEHTSRTDNGTTYEVCMCGASRKHAHGETPGAWHTCERCTHWFGRD